MTFRSPVFARKLLGAAMLGVGAILQNKTDPNEHWSSTPKVTLVAPDEVGDGEPDDDEPDDSGDP
jgi:hypothetical protein